MICNKCKLPTDGQPFCSCGNKKRLDMCLDCNYEWDGYEKPDQCPQCGSNNLKKLNN